jgi:hypothetical protein
LELIGEAGFLDAKLIELKLELVDETDALLLERGLLTKDGVLDIVGDVVVDGKDLISPEFRDSFGSVLFLPLLIVLVFVLSMM